MGYKLYIEDFAKPAVYVLPDTDPIPLDQHDNPYLEDSQDLIKWKNNGLDACNDYGQFKTRIGEQLDLKTWVNLSNDERDFMIELDLKETSVSEQQDGTNKITHLISTGQATTTEEARIVIVNAWAAHHVLDIESCTARAKALKLYIEIGTYLSKADAIDLFETINNLYVGFRDQAIKGTLDGSGTGIYNYVESTVGTVYEFAGLASKGYTMQNGDLDMTNFVVALMRILREGRYTLN